ncbi:MAG: hypothetical protein MJ010_02500 [Paludibacteraceae bacterium]|nr:hypothetical protein [Paludibacteraceae bacterium]
MIQIQQNITLFPRWMSNKSIAFYFIALLLVSAIYQQFSLPWYYMLSGSVSVFVFFHYATTLSRQWTTNKITTDKRFEKKIFWASFAIRFVWMTLIYIVFQTEYDNAFGFENGDATFYSDSAKNVASLIINGQFDEIVSIFGDMDISDIGYAIYLGLVYALTDNSIYISRIIKCLLSAWTVLFMFRIAKVNYGDNIARLTAIFCMLWPNFWYYCGTSLKETEMVFLGVLFVYMADSMLRTTNFSAWEIIPILLISAALFTFRTALALLTVLCLLFSIVMSSTKVIGWGKRIIIGFLALLLIGVTMGNSVMEHTTELVEEVQSGKQAYNMEWRARREHGNKFAKYAGKTVFAPLIFTIPFPTMIRPFEGQENQQLLNGGNYIKNILSFFVILSMFMLLFSGKWRNNLVPLSYLIGYMVILAMSQYAQSERFHQPAMPIEFMFAAYGLSQVLKGVPVYKNIGSRIKYKKWFNMWCVLMFVAAIAWGWFKLAGRGLI